MESKKNNLDIFFIPSIMFVITVLISFANDEITRKVLLIIASFLLGIHVQRCVEIIKARKKE